jgi:hypothetical protein
MGIARCVGLKVIRITCIYMVVHREVRTRHEIYRPLFAHLTLGWSSDRMYRYDIKLRLWERVTPVGEALHVSGDHTGVVYRDHMLVFGT